MLLFSLFLNFFLSFYLSRFSFYIDTYLCFILNNPKAIPRYIKNCFNRSSSGILKANIYNTETKWKRNAGKLESKERIATSKECEEISTKVEDTLQHMTIDTFWSHSDPTGKGSVRSKHYHVQCVKLFKCIYNFYWDLFMSICCSFDSHFH